MQEDLLSRDDPRFSWRVVEERLRPFLLRRLAQPDADDVLQEVLLRLHRGLPRLREDDRVSAWMYQVARNAIADHHRARARHPVIAARGDGAPTLAEPYTMPVEPEDGLGERELAANLAPLVARLPSPYREAITLVELEGQTQRAAARSSGVSLSGMKSRVQRGRARLRELLEACCSVAVDVRGQILSAESRDPSGCCGERRRAQARAGTAVAG